MARIIRHRPKYIRGRGVIHYQIDGREYLRGRPLQVRNPRTPEQMRVRSGFRLMQLTMAPIQELFHLGFRAEYKDNGRRVGGYHVALRENLLNAIHYDAQGHPRVNYPGLRISQGMASLADMKIQRGGGKLLITHRPLVDCRFEVLLVAAQSLERAEWICYTMASDFHTGHHEVSLPEGWQRDSLHLYVGAGGEGDQKRQHCESQYFLLGPE